MFNVQTLRIGKNAFCIINLDNKMNCFLFAHIHLINNPNLSIKYKKILPNYVPLTPDITVKTIEMADSRVCAITIVDKLICWSIDHRKFRYIKIIDTLKSNIKSITIGPTHMCAFVIKITNNNNTNNPPTYLDILKTRTEGNTPHVTSLPIYYSNVCWDYNQEVKDGPTMASQVFAEGK